MTINFNNFQTLNRLPAISNKPSIMPYGAGVLPYPFSIVQGNLSSDIFTKTQGPKSLTPINSAAFSPNEARLREIYDEVYMEVVAQNPILKELNIQKPIFVFKNIENKPGEKIDFAGYNFSNNSIELTSNFCEDFYAAGIKDESGNLAEIIDVNIKSVMDEEFDECKKLEPNLTAIKLAESEKEFYIRGSIAHELRHWIQDHIMASNKNTMNKHRKFFQKISSKIDRTLKGLDRSELSKEDRLAIDISYALNYKPKKILNEKYFKLSRLPKDNRYWSLKKHILKATTDNNYNSNYFASPIEADANYFAFEYLTSKAPEAYSEQMRKDIITGTIMYYKNKANEAIRDMEKCGYPPLEEI